MRKNRTGGEDAATTGFAITVPDSWFELELRPSLRDDAIRALVYERVREQPELRESRPTIVRILREYADTAWESGARFCGCMVEPTTEGPITASVTVTLIDAPPNSTAPTTTEERIDAVLAAIAPAGSSAPKDAPALTVAVLPNVGESARTYGREVITLPSGQQIPTLGMQTFVPIPGSSGLALISCSSPILWMDEELLDLFDAVTGTFTFL